MKSEKYKSEGSEIISSDNLNDFKEELINEFRKILQQYDKPQKKWLKTSEVRKLLGISANTLQTLRINRLLSGAKIGGIVYYNIDEIEQMFQKNRI